MDRTDVALSLFLMTNSRTPYHELAGKLGLSINAVHKRIRAMMEEGVIRNFTARPSLISLRAITVWIYGSSEADRSDDVHLRLGRGGTTYWVAYSEGGYIYVGGYLRDLSELDAYVSLVKKEARMGEPTVGIMPQMMSRFPGESLRPLDYQILASLHKDSRKPVTEVASEVHASAKTIHRRLERMVEKELVDFSIDWYPDVSNDIISICHVGVTPGADRAKVMSDLTAHVSENILVNTVFSNLPNQFALFLWTNSMRQMDDLRERISRSSDVGSVMTNVLQIGYMFDTWRDSFAPRDLPKKISASD